MIKPCFYRNFHTYSVAKLMRSKCEELGKGVEYSEEMYTLGLLHDFGYEFDANNHNTIGADIMERTGYKYHNEIRYHSVPNPDYSSFELDLLNWADMHIDYKGKWVTLDERLQDIARRYDMESEAYINSCIVAKHIEHLFD